MDNIKSTLYDNSYTAAICGEAETEAVFEKNENIDEESQNTDTPETDSKSDTSAPGIKTNTEEAELLEPSPRHKFYRTAVLSTIALITAASFIVTGIRYLSPEAIASLAINKSFYIPNKAGAEVSFPTSGIIDNTVSINGITETSAHLSDEELYSYDLSLIPEGERAIIPEDLSAASKNGSLTMNNETAYSPNLEALAAAPMPTEPVYSQNEPKVLIIHTHGTESYTPENDISYSDGDTMRDSDPENNVVAVGEVLAKTLEENGVPTLHCTVMHDKESYYNAYLRAKATTAEYLEMYPSIEYVFDVHRDSIIYATGEKVKPVAAINGKAAAQLMLVIGTDAKGANHPKWEDNLNIAAKIQYLMNDEYGNLMRPINLRNAGFNGELAKGSMIIEFGSCGNTLEEAKYSAELFGKTAAELIKKGEM